MLYITYNHRLTAQNDLHMKDQNFSATGITTQYVATGNTRIHTDKTIEIQEDTYYSLATRLKEAIGNNGYYNGSIDTDCGEIYSSFTATLIIYRTDESYPEGVCSTISDIVPVWWEYSTEIAGEGEVLNDFCFSSLKKALLSVN